MKHMSKLELTRAFLAIKPDITNAQLAAATDTTIKAAASNKCRAKKETREAEESIQ